MRRNTLIVATVAAILLLLNGAQSEWVGAQESGTGAQGNLYLPLLTKPDPVKIPTGGDGIWLSPQEIAAMPTSGPGWQKVLEWANDNSSSPNLSDQDDQTDAVMMAKALVYVRTGEQKYRDDVVNAIDKAIGTEDGGRVLALGRNLAAYVIAADLINLDGALDARFRDWLSQVRHEVLDGRTLVNTHEERPNNWGTHAGASRIAVALYLGDTADLERAAAVFKGFVGDRSAYSGFSFGDLSWQCNPSQPVGINPAGCMKNGFVLDGVLPDDQRRAGELEWPPPKENYAWEALQGVTAQAWMLHRAGYPAFEWQDYAVLRAVKWLHDYANFPATADDSGTPWLINHVYGEDFPTTSPARPGKNGLGFYEWYFGH